jgi:hypothetical protein
VIRPPRLPRLPHLKGESETPKPAHPPDETAIADALAAEGYALEAAFVRHFKGRPGATWQEIVEAVCPGEERDWGTVKTWCTRVKNALSDLDPHCRLTFRTTIRGHRITKKIHPE